MERNKQQFSCTDIVRLLVNKITPDSNFIEQLWFISRADHREAQVHLCLLLRTHFDFQPQGDDGSFFHNCSFDSSGTYHKPFAAIGIPTYAKAIVRRALLLQDAKQRLQDDPRPFPFLHLPLEIRLQVYKCAFANVQTVNLKLYRDSHGRSQPLKCFFLGCNLVVKAGKRRFGKDIDTALLLTNRQIFDEAEPILYQTRIITIGFYLHKGLEFLQSLSPRARRNIRAVDVALPDRCRCGLDHPLQYWRNLFAYMSQNLQIHVLFSNVSLRAIPANFADEIWVKDLIKMRELRHLVQLPFTFVDDPKESAHAGGGGDSGQETELYRVLSSRREAFLSYIRSEMRLSPASRLLPAEEEGGN